MRFKGELSLPLPSALPPLYRRLRRGPDPTAWGDVDDVARVVGDVAEGDWWQAKVDVTNCPPLPWPAVNGQVEGVVERTVSGSVSRVGLADELFLAE